MPSADALRRRPFLLSVITGLVVGSIVGVFLPIRAAVPPKTESEVWRLPNAQSLVRSRDDHYQQVRNARFWGDLTLPGQRPARPAQSNWALAAIMTRPATQVSVRTTANAAPTWVRIGAELPDGSTLVAVTRDRVWFEKEDCKRVRSLYPNPKKPDPEGCIGQPAGQQAQAAPAKPLSSKPTDPRRQP